MGAMMRQEAIELILKVVNQPDAFDQIERHYLNIPHERLIEEIVQVGILPEQFDHDSSEEKMWSKFSDVVLACAMRHLGLSSQVIRTRGNSADVFSFTADYSMVGDAKCFRLSRTAKNQKDFKIKALDDWRRENTYALLVAPLYDYPLHRSQIYAQAITRNVTLLSYTHLRFLLKHHPKTTLQPLWEIGRVLNQQRIEPYGKPYWNAVDALVTDLCGVSPSVLRSYKEDEISLTMTLASEGMAYWQSKVATFQTLTREEAIQLLIQSQKIDQKILTLQKVITRKYVV